jgi:resuscitation-promoting factor RpfB
MPSMDELILGRPIRVDLARQVVVAHDGHTTTGFVRASDVAGMLRELGLSLGPSDRVYVEDRALAPQDSLPPVSASTLGRPGDLLVALREPVHLRVRRAVRVTLHEDGLAGSFVTAARTVGEALRERGIALYEADSVRPAPESPIVAGLTINLERSLPVQLHADGDTLPMRTRSGTVDELLSEAGISLGPKDYVVPAGDTVLESDMRVEVVRIAEEYYVEEIPIAFRVRQVADPDLEIDQWQVEDWGHEGALRRRVRVLFENGREQFRTEEEEWIALEPQDRIIRYGTKIVMGTEMTSDGPITYWRKLRMLATSYNAPTAGKPMDHPYYGITRVGLRARYGIIAVDPRVIPLGQSMYVPGYGQGLAADTGSAIKWRRVDLCYDDHNLILWLKWVDVYLLGPVPPRDEILWIVPNYPNETD